MPMRGFDLPILVGGGRSIHYSAITFYYHSNQGFMRDFLVVGGREEVPSCDVCAVINALTAYLLFSTVHTAENFTIQWDRVHNNAHLGCWNIHIPAHTLQEWNDCLCLQRGQSTDLYVCACVCQSVYFSVYLTACQSVMLLY